MLLIAQTSAQATPTIDLMVDNAAGTPFTAAKAGLFIIDHLLDTAACTLAGFMFQKASKNLFPRKTNA